MGPSWYVLTERTSYDNEYIISSLPSLYLTLYYSLSISVCVYVKNLQSDESQN